MGVPHYIGGRDTSQRSNRVNPRRACAARVTVDLVCASDTVCVCVCLHLSRPTGTKPAHQWYQRL